MNTTNKKKLLVPFAIMGAAVALLTGCASAPENHLAVTQMPPSLFVELAPLGNAPQTVTWVEQNPDLRSRWDSE